MALDPVDAVIVGAGGGGGVVAYELAKAGWNVVLLERGRAQTFAETGHSELHSQRTTVLGNAFGPDDTRHLRIREAENGRWVKVLPSDGAYNNVAACVGGGTLSYGAMAWRFLPKDFQMRSTYGAPAGSTLEDWPLRYEELEPYYAKAEWEIGVSGKAGANHFEGKRSKDYPMPPLPFNREASLLAPAARKLGWHPFPIPMAINSIPYQGRPACVQCPHCVGFRCEVDAKSSTAVTVIPRAIATGHCKLRTECVVKEVLLDKKGDARGVAYFNADGELVEQLARVVVVAASATETPRLLLNSKNAMHPNGLGNRYDWVGRNLQGHAYSGAFGLFEQETWDGVGPAARVALCDHNHGNEGCVGGGMLANEFIRLPYLFARSVRPPGAPRWGQAHKDWQRRWYKRSMGVKGPVQEVPRWENRVEIDPVAKDAWGIPTLRLSGRKHPSDLKTGKYVAARAAEWLRAAGAIEVVETLPGMGLSGGQHQAGTARMASEAKLGVVDRDCRVFGTSNVYIADGSVHVTNGGFNPSLTIQALAFRTSERILAAGHPGKRG
ncbi:FAD-dependent oxidoreductase [Bryobacter aggregatus]|uniref:FAD-dependent oxidoreductase n=1 Tax=Bryobacter aggregatus TaxID=360054 RepID=UPI0004E0BA27|nr:GMC family oxidoreductase [Bryobacter aggregatus]